MIIFISSNSEDTFFVGKVNDCIREQNVNYHSLTGDSIRSIFPPTQRGRSTQISLTEKIFQINNSDLVVMNITPEEIESRYFINSGVLIEYGILIGRNELGKLSLFCDEQYNRPILSPIFHGRDIQAFNRDETGEQLISLITPIITDFIREAIDEYRRLGRHLSTAQQYIFQQNTSSRQSTYTN